MKAGKLSRTVSLNSTRYHCQVQEGVVIEYTLWVSRRYLFRTTVISLDYLNYDILNYICVTTVYLYLEGLRACARATHYSEPRTIDK